jgi:hypothetical protein
MTVMNGKVFEYVRRLNEQCRLASPLPVQQRQVSPLRQTGQTAKQRGVQTQMRTRSVRADRSRRSDCHCTVPSRWEDKGDCGRCPVLPRRVGRVAFSCFRGGCTSNQIVDVQAEQNRQKIRDEVEQYQVTVRELLFKQYRFSEGKGDAEPSLKASFCASVKDCLFANRCIALGSTLLESSVEFVTRQLRAFAFGQPDRRQSANVRIVPLKSEATRRRSVVPQIQLLRGPVAQSLLIVAFLNAIHLSTETFETLRFVRLGQIAQMYGMQQNVTALSLGGQSDRLLFSVSGCGGRLMEERVHSQATRQKRVFYELDEELSVSQMAMRDAILSAKQADVEVCNVRFADVLDVVQFERLVTDEEDAERVAIVQQSSDLVNRHVTKASYRNVAEDERIVKGKANTERDRIELVRLVIVVEQNLNFVTFQKDAVHVKHHDGRKTDEFDVMQQFVCTATFVMSHFR